MSPVVQLFQQHIINCVHGRYLAAIFLLTPKQLVFFLCMVFFAARPIHLYAIGPVQKMLNQHRGYWWCFSTKASVATMLMGTHLW